MLIHETKEESRKRRPRNVGSMKESLSLVLESVSLWISVGIKQEYKPEVQDDNVKKLAKHV